MGRPHFQVRAAIKALELSAYHLGCLAQGDVDAAGKYAAASTAWAALSKMVAEHVERAPHMQWVYDQFPTY